MSEAADAEARTGPNNQAKELQRHCTAAKNEHIGDTLHTEEQQQIARRGLHTEQLLGGQVTGPDTGGWAMILQLFRLLFPGSGDRLRRFMLQTCVHCALNHCTKPGHLPGWSAQGRPSDRCRGPGVPETARLIT